MLSKKKTKLFTKIIPQNIFIKRLPNVAMFQFQICSRKRLPKIIFQSGSRKLLREVTTQSCPTKFYSKNIVQNSLPKLRLFKVSIRNCRAKQLLKAPPASQSCSPKLLNKAVPQSRSPKLLSRATSKNCFPKLLKFPPKVVVESKFPKLFSKATPSSYRFSK